MQHPIVVDLDIGAIRQHACMKGDALIIESGVHVLLHLGPDS